MTPKQYAERLVRFAGKKRAKVIATDLTYANPRIDATMKGTLNGKTVLTKEEAEEYWKEVRREVDIVVPSW